MEGEPRTKLIEVVTGINGRWLQETAKPADEATLKALDAKLWETWDQYLVKRHRNAGGKGKGKGSGKGATKGGAK